MVEGNLVGPDPLAQYDQPTPRVAYLRKDSIVIGQLQSLVNRSDEPASAHATSRHLPAL